jgi:ribonuclease P protein subunit POP4
MHITEYLKTEFIGKQVTILHCTDPAWTNKTGCILDETKKTFIIDIDGQKKRIAKKIATFEINIEGKNIRINGSQIQYRPEERIKKTR